MYAVNKVSACSSTENFGKYCNSDAYVCENRASNFIGISLIADHRKCCAQGIMGLLRVNTVLFDWWIFTLSRPIILSAWYFWQTVT